MLTRVRNDATGLGLGFCFAIVDHGAAEKKCSDYRGLRSVRREILRILDYTLRMTSGASARRMMVGSRLVDFRIGLPILRNVSAGCGRLGLLFRDPQRIADEVIECIHADILLHPLAQSC